MPDPEEFSAEDLEQMKAGELRVIQGREAQAAAAVAERLVMDSPMSEQTASTIESRFQALVDVDSRPPDQLRAYGSYGAAVGETGEWSLGFGPGPDFHQCFNDLGARAGIAVGASEGVNARDFFLDQLLCWLRHNNKKEFLFGVGIGKDQGGMILRVCEASMMYWRWLKVRAQVQGPISEPKQWPAPKELSSRKDEPPVKIVPMYHRMLRPRYVREGETNQLGPEWSRTPIDQTYIHQDYPKTKYHRTKPPVTVKDSQEEAALGPGWADSPSAFAAEAATVTTERSNPLRWVDDWLVPNLSDEQRVKIKAEILKAGAVFSRESQTNSMRHLAPMREAFNGIAKMLFEARNLTDTILENEIPILVWDCAIAGGWWHPASDEPSDGFPEQLGHYRVWAGHSQDRAEFFRAEISEWRSRLLVAAVRGKPASRAYDRNRKRSSDLGVERLKQSVRILRGEGLTHREICERLGNKDRPPRASWRDLPWPLAYRRHTRAVTKWLSEASASLPSVTI